MGSKKKVPVISRLVCGECGKELEHGTKECTGCGSSMEWTENRPAVASGTCPVCGHVNKAPGSFCEECGSSIATIPTPKGKSRPADRDGFKLEPWHYAAGIAMIAILGYFVVSEYDRQSPPLKTPTAVDDHNHEGDPHGESAGAIRELEQLQKAIDADPTDAPSILRKANILHDLSLRDPRLLLRAIEAYDRYLDLKSDDPDARVDLGIVYFELARVDTGMAGVHLDRAVKEMEQVAKTHPKHQAAAFNLGIVNLNSGNTEASTKWFRRTVEIDATSDLGQRAQRLLEQHSF